MRLPMTRETDLFGLQHLVFMEPQRTGTGAFAGAEGRPMGSRETPQEPARSKGFPAQRAAAGVQWCAVLEGTTERGARLSRATPTVAARRPGTPGSLVKSRRQKPVHGKSAGASLRQKSVLEGRESLDSRTTEPNPRHGRAGAARAKAPYRHPVGQPGAPAPESGHRLFIDLE